jgi:hypothetical protein
MSGNGPVVDPSSWENSAAGIATPGQVFGRKIRLYGCEHMVFNSWNRLPEHMLGSVNRMRLAVYPASRQARRKLNMVPS